VPARQAQGVRVGVAEGGALKVELSGDAVWISGDGPGRVLLDGDLTEDLQIAKLKRDRVFADRVRST